MVFLGRVGVLFQHYCLGCFTAMDKHADVDSDSPKSIDGNPQLVAWL
jgi:hypothetical protein